MSVVFRDLEMDRSDILRALAEFDKKYPDTNQYDNWLDKKNYHYAIRYEGRLYPPKYICSEVTGKPLAQLYGRTRAIRRFFTKLGFEVIRKREK